MWSYWTGTPAPVRSLESQNVRGPTRLHPCPRPEVVHDRLQPTQRATQWSPQGARTRRDARAANNRSGKPRRLWLRRILWAALMVAVLGLLFVGISYATIKPPKPNDIGPRASVIYYADGKTELQRISQINRESVNIADLPEHVGEAMLATEDRGFYQEERCLPKGMLRAVIVAIKGGGATQGGSTITQQYVKNYFLSSDRTLTRKYKEILLSIKIDQQQSKQQILENYLNTIYYGRGAYGIETAAQAYTASPPRTSPSRSRPSSPRHPRSLDLRPQVAPENLKNVTTRWNYVLDGMVSQGWLDQATRQAMQFPTPIEWKPPTATGTNGYLVQLIKSELKAKLKLSDADIERGGLQVVSTIEKPRQDAAVAAVQESMPADAPTFASVWPRSSPATGRWSPSTAAPTMPPSSSTRPPTPRCRRGRPSTVHSDRRPPGGQGQPPQHLQRGEPAVLQRVQRTLPPTSRSASRGGVRNFGNTGFGTIDVSTATANSVNTVYAQLNILATPKATAEAAKAAGVTSEVAANYGNVFGTSSVKVLEMANACDDRGPGQAGRPTSSPRPERRRRLRLQRQPRGHPGLRRRRDGRHDLCHAAGRPARQWQDGPGRRPPLAGKTGTTSDNKAAWFDGFAPQLATAVGMYRPGPNGEELSMQDVGGMPRSPVGRCRSRCGRPT